MAPLAKESNEKFSYADYLSWPDGERWEIIEGVPYNMSAAPAREHQKLSAIIFAKIYNFLSGKECEVYFAPFDVRLAETKDEMDEEIETVVQPDIVVVCDQNKLDKRGCFGNGVCLEGWRCYGRNIIPLYILQRPDRETAAL